MIMHPTIWSVLCCEIQNICCLYLNFTSEYFLINVYCVFIYCTYMTKLRLCDNFDEQHFFRLFARAVPITYIIWPVLIILIFQIFASKFLYRYKAPRDLFNVLTKEALCIDPSERRHLSSSLNLSSFCKQKYL